MSDQSPMDFYDADGKLWMHLEVCDPLVVHPNGKEILRIHADGRITVTEDASPTETAKQVLDAMSDMLKGMLVQQWNAAIESAAENFECEDSFYGDEIRESILRLKK